MVSNIVFATILEFLLFLYHLLIYNLITIYNRNFTHSIHFSFILKLTINYERSKIATTIVFE